MSETAAFVPPQRLAVICAEASCPAIELLAASEHFLRGVNVHHRSARNGACASRMSPARDLSNVIGGDPRGCGIG